jgi:FtsH-binding integral membrane protein
MDWLISFVGVIVFTGLTAYHTQKISQSYAVNAEGSAMYRKSVAVHAHIRACDLRQRFEVGTT